MRLSILCLAALCASVSAQSTTVVIPDGLATTEGSTLDWATARYLPARSQMLYDASVLTGLSSTAITKVGVRANYSSSSTYPAHDVMTTLRIGFSATKTAATASTTSFMANHPTTFVTVLNNVKVSYPAVSGTTPNPRGFVSIPLSTPAPYVAGNTLIMQWDVASVSGATETWLWYNDAQFYRTTSGGTWTYSGVTCPSGSTSLGSGGAPGANLSWYFYSGSGNDVPAAGIIGTSKTSWSGIPLPFDLTPFGASGCSVLTNHAAVIGGQKTDPTGTLGRIRYDVPMPSTVPNGLQLYTQTFVLDPTYNSLGVRASRLHEYKYSQGTPTPAIVLIDYARTISDTPRVNYNDGVVFSIN